MSTATQENPSVAPPEPLLNRDDLAAIFKVTRGTIKTWEYQGKLPTPLKLGRRSLFRQSEIARLISSKGAMP